MLRHIQTFGQSSTCLQCVNICCVFVGDISFEIKTEADSNDITEYPHDDIPSTGMFVLYYECILCTTFALMFMSFYYMHQNKYVSLFICPMVLLESHPEHRPSLHVYPDSFRQYQYKIILLCYRSNGLLEGFLIQQRRDPELTPC